MASGFKDLDPTWKEDLKNKKKITKALNMESLMGLKLLYSVKIEEKKCFREFMESGKGMSANEIKNLHPYLKKDYINKVVKDSLEVKKFAQE